MTKSQCFEFYNHFGKFREPSLESIFDKNESEGVNGSLPFFVYCNSIGVIMYKGYFLFLGIFVVCFLACSGDKDKGLEDLKDIAKPYEGGIDNIGCVSLENYLKNVKKGYSKALDSLKKDSVLTQDSLNKFFEKRLGVGCDSVSLRINNGPYNVNVFLQNSTSMDGFINDKTNFKSQTSKLLNELTSKNGGTLYHVNKSFIDSDVVGKNIGDSIKALDYRSFVQKGYMQDTTATKNKVREYTNLKHIMKVAIDSTNSYTMSVVISDLNMNLNILKEDTSGFGFLSFEYIVDDVSSGIKRLLMERPDLSLFVLRLESSFFGYYYADNGKCYIDSKVDKAMQGKIEPSKKERDKLKGENNELWQLHKALQNTPKNLVGDMKYRSGQEFAKIINEIDDNDKPRIDSIGKRIGQRMGYIKTKIDSYDSEISYFDKKCKETLNSFSRPYFIWIFGTEPQLEDMLKAQFFREKNMDIAKYIRKSNHSTSKLQVLDCPEYKGTEKNECKKGKSYNVPDLAFYKTIGDSIYISKNQRKKLEIPVKLNFGRITRIASSILENTAHYNLNNENFIIKKLPNSNEFIVESKDNGEYDIYGIRSLEAKIEPKYDWNKYSCNDDLNFADNYEKKQTSGLDSLLGKIHSLFYEQPLDSFQIKIGVK
jgi:hypothetical protein